MTTEQRLEKLKKQKKDLQEVIGPALQLALNPNVTEDKREAASLIYSSLIIQETLIDELILIYKSTLAKIKAN